MVPGLRRPPPATLTTRPAEMAAWPCRALLRTRFADDDDGSELPRRFAPRDAVRLAQGTPAGLTAPLRPPWRGPLAAPFGVFIAPAAAAFRRRQREADHRPHVAAGGGIESQAAHQTMISAAG